jgi:hypothetical protein
MFFILRLLFWFSLVLFFLPFGVRTTGENGQDVDAVRAISAAKSAVEDIAGMCERNPDVCVTGKAAIRVIGERAREGARAALDGLDKGSDPDAPRPPAPVGQPQQ